MMKKLFSPVKKHPLWGFDIETYGDKNRFLMCSIVGDYNVRKIFWEKKEFFRFIKSSFMRDRISRGYVTATNLQFDIMGLIEGTKEFEDFTPIIRNSRFILVKLPIGTFQSAKFIDTASFCYFSVKKWGEILGLPKLKEPACFRRKPKNRNEKEELEAYNLRDSEITYRAIKFIQDGYNRLGGELKITASASALDLYRRKFQEKTYFHPERKLLELIYKAYYGGRVEAVKRGPVKNLKYYDYNSLYPSVMQENDYPDPNHFKHSFHIKKSSIREYEGIARATLKISDISLPFLPYRQIKPEPKLIFPEGRFTGYYSFHELRKAIEIGYDIEKLMEGVIYFKRMEPFREYVDILYDIRKKQKENNDPMEIMSKLSMNSLYGKFAQKIDEKDVIMHESKVTYEMLQKAPYAERNGKFFTFKEPCNRIAQFINPIFSVYVTSYAREKLYDRIVNCGIDKVYYYDTDSIITSRTLEDSKRLGKLKEEFFIREGMIIKPKMYAFDNIVRCKGLGKMDRKGFDTLLTDRKKSIEKFVKFKEANKRGLFYNEILRFEKHIDLEDNKRLWPFAFSPFNIQDSGALKI